MAEDKSNNKPNNSNDQDSLPLFFNEEEASNKEPVKQEPKEPVKLEAKKISKPETDSAAAASTEENTKKDPEAQPAKATIKLVDTSTAAPEKANASVLKLTPKEDAKTTDSTNKTDSATENKVDTNAKKTDEPKANPVKLEAKAVKNDAAKAEPVKLDAKAVKNDSTSKEPVKLEAKTVEKPDELKSEQMKQDAKNSSKNDTKPEPIKMDKIKPEATAKATTKTNENSSAKQQNDQSQEKPASNQALKKKNVQVVANISSEKVTIGQILQESRVSYDLSLNQVEQITKIKKSFIESLERDDFKDLPPLVYVTAYVKTLCELYEIGQDETAEIIKKLKEKNDTSPVSEEIISHLEEEKQINHGEELKIKRIFIVGMVAIVLVVIAVAIIASIYFIPKEEKTKTPDGKVIVKSKTVPPLTNEQLKELLAPQMSTMTELDVPK